MTGPVLRAGAWMTVVGVSGVAVVVGGLGDAFPAAASVLLPICFALLAAGGLVMLVAAVRGLALMAPSLVPQVARWARTFPEMGAGGPSSNHLWWIVLAACVVAIVVSVGGDRGLHRWVTVPGLVHRTFG